jgi:hypothetical protein
MLLALHTRDNTSVAGVMHSAWSLSAIEVKRPSDPHHPGIVNLQFSWQSTYSGWLTILGKIESHS